MSFQFGGNNPYQSSASNEELFLKKKGQNPFTFNYEQPVREVSLFDIATEADLNDTGRHVTSNDIFGNIELGKIEAASWLGLTGKGAMGDEPPLMKTSFLQAPPRKTDDDTPKKDNGLDWSWNTFA